MKTEEDSFEEYKKYLQSTVEGSQIQKPHMPMNPYVRFFLQRSSQQRSKGRTLTFQLTKEISEEWKKLSDTKKEYYEKIYNVRIRERNSLLQEYTRLSGKRKVVPPYGRYVKKRYAQYKKQYKNYNSQEINRLVKNDWKVLNPKQKKKLYDEYQKEKNDLSLGIDKADKIAQYNSRLARFHEQLSEQKEKILKKYGLTKQNRIRVRREEKKAIRDKKRAERNLQRQQRLNEQRQKKQKAKQAQKIKKQQDKELQRKQKQAEKEKERLEKQKKKEEQTDKKRKESEKDKSKVKRQPEEDNKKSKKEVSKSKSKGQKAKKKSLKSKKIKKAVPKQTKKTKEVEKKAKNSKKQIKIKSSKNAKVIKRGKRTK